jgi:putative toxin-antitoxin system antitoxin component (TIGR02293 family)
LGDKMAEAQEQLLDWFGMEAASKGAEVLAMVERRFPPAMVERLLELGLDQEEIDAIVLPTRRAQPDRVNKQALTVSESDRLIRLLRVLSLAERVYGSRVRALRWLRRPNGRLGQPEQDDADTAGRRPISLLTTDIGARMVEELLLQIDEGYFIS